MRILSINFGHDASLAFFENGELIEFEELERQSRLRYHLGIRAEYIDHFLERCELNFAGVDLVALSSTQGWAMAHCDEVELKRGWSEAHQEFCDCLELWTDSDFWEGSIRHPFYDKHVELQGLTKFTPSVSRLEFKFPFLRGPKIDQSNIVNLVNSVSSLDQLTLKYIKANFLCPYTLGLRSIAKPAFYINHHTCHAYYAYFYSGAKNSIVCTHDGALSREPFFSGGIYLSDADKGVVPLITHNLGLGRLYDVVADVVGVQDPGKLMGLSAYASPSIDSLEVVQDCLELRNETQLKHIVERLLSISASNQSIRMRSVGKFCFNFANAHLAAQTAANVQLLVQSLFVIVIGGIATTVWEARPDISYLDLTGGFTLNCPSNYLLQQKCSPFKVNPLPGAGDTGLAVGSAVALNDFLGVSVNRQIDPEGLIAAFPPSSVEYNVAITRLESVEKIDISKEKIPRFISDRLLEGSVLCIHRGRSEVGPRALGRRSIIAHAVNEFLRDRINLAKGREPWRPLAPICRREDFHEYFDGDPVMGRYMLFTCCVRNDGIPAVTHVDGTARVQCIDKCDEWLHPALGYLKSAGHHPVIVNTSFNCAGEPLVETLDHAINSFVNLGFEYLVTEVGVFRPKAVT